MWSLSPHISPLLLIHDNDDMNIFSFMTKCLKTSFLFNESKKTMLTEHLFYKTLLEPSAFINKISVRFYQMDCIRYAWLIYITAGQESLLNYFQKLLLLGQKVAIHLWYSYTRPNLQTCSQGIVGLSYLSCKIQKHTYVQLFLYSHNSIVSFQWIFNYGCVHCVPC